MVEPTKKKRQQSAAARTIGKRTRAAPPELEELASEAEFWDRQARETQAATKLQPGRLAGKPEDELGSRLQAAREERRWTQGELAELTRSLDGDDKGVSRAVISLYEAGTNRPSPREIRLLCEALRITPNFLIYGDDDPFNALAEEGRSGTAARHDPEGFAWMAYVMTSLHHNHFDALMKLALDVQRRWDAGFDQGAQDKANEQLLSMAEGLKERLALRRKIK
jgi:transcriptional regulator with XRE-family HTH domain